MMMPSTRGSGAAAERDSLPSRARSTSRRRRASRRAMARRAEGRAYGRNYPLTIDDVPPPLQAGPLRLVFVQQLLLPGALLLDPVHLLPNQLVLVMDHLGEGVE